MLPSDIAMINDKKLKKFVEIYANDEELFFVDFKNSFVKLGELGIDFKGKVPVEFKLREQRIKYIFQVFITFIIKYIEYSFLRFLF